MSGEEPTFWQALRDRKMVQVLVIYAGAAWGILEFTEFAVDNYGLSRRLLDGILFLLVVGIPAALTITWFHGERGDQKAPRLEKIVLSSLVLIAVSGLFWVTTRTPTGGAVAGDGDESIAVDLGSESVAVLPFHNRITDPELEWLGAGVAELLTTGLAQVPDLSVVSAQRLFDLLRAEGQEDAESIPDALATRLTRKAGARYMVDGSILGSGSDITVNANLVDIESGEIAAAAQARGTDVFALVDEISGELSGSILAVAGLQAAKGAASPVSVATLTTDNLEAFREFQLGIQSERRFRRDEALDHYRRATEMDPTFAVAHMRLAELALDAGQISLSIASFQAAEENRESAPERDRLYLDAILAFRVGDNFDAAVATMEELIRKYPDDKEARDRLGRVYDQGSPERRRYLEEILALDPLDAPAYNDLSYWYARAGDFEAADSVNLLYIVLEPGQPNPLDSRGEILEMAGRIDEAREAYRQALAIQPSFVFSLSHLADSYFDANRPLDAIAELEPWTRHEIPAVRANALLLTADGWLQAGEVDRALETLDSAAEQARFGEDLGAEGLVYMLSLPVFMTVHDFDRLLAATRRLNEFDPLNPIAGFSAHASYGEARNLEAMNALGTAIRTQLRTTPSLQRFEPLVSSALQADEAFYTGDYGRALDQILTMRSLGGLPHNGTFLLLRSLAEVGDGDELLRRARTVDRDAAKPLGGDASPIYDRFSWYFQGRAYELLADTAAAIDSYDRLLEGKWSESVARFPVLADAPDRREALQP